MLTVSTGYSKADSSNWGNQDSIKVEKSDLKLNNGFLLELLYRREQMPLLKSQLNDWTEYYKRSSEQHKYDSLNTEHWKQTAKDNLPSWYDHFAWGASITALIFTILIMVIK